MVGLLLGLAIGLGLEKELLLSPEGGGGGEGRCACILLLQSHVVNPGTAVRRARVPLPVALAKFLLCLVLVSLGGINSLIKFFSLGLK